MGGNQDFLFNPFQEKLTEPGPEFDGSTYEPEKDKPRLTNALARVVELMKDGKKRRLRDIADSAGCSESGASARLRDLRKEKFQTVHGFWIVHRERQSGGLWVYWLSKKG